MLISDLLLQIEPELKMLKSNQIQNLKINIIFKYNPKKN